MSVEQTESGLPTLYEQDHRRRRAQRVMAYGSWGFLLCQSAVFGAALILHPERAAITAAMQGASALLIATNTMLTTIVLAYLGVSLTEVLNKK